jgi:excinuclease ABC subunit C
MSKAPQNPDHLKSLVSVLPEKPGVYQYFNIEGKIIYVGKAKSLKKRVSSYFNKDHDSVKTNILVSKIADIKHIIVETEEEALLLENTLIKKYQPRYNVLLKDDKTYPWICIKNEAFPRIILTRNLSQDGSAWFGPYGSVKMVRTLLEFIRQIYQVRTCNLNLAPDQIAKGKYNVCLEYHIGNCLGPCIGKQNEDDYSQTIIDVKNILKGNIMQVINHLKGTMMQLSSELRFEEAHAVKEKLEHLENYRSKSTVVNPDIHNVDVFTILDDIGIAYVNFLKVANGAIIQSHTVEIKKRLDESKEELLEIAIGEIRQKIFSDAREILIPFALDIEFANVKFSVPQRGDKVKLIELSERNLKYYRLEKVKQLSKVDPEMHTNRIMETMKRDLNLERHPRHIECFDNSNLQGTNAVAACVVFKDGKPSKKDYRHFNIKTVEGPDDFASMEEVLRRRYSRLLAENQPLPDLVVIDGGKGQLHSAVNIFEELKLFPRVMLISIAKRLEEIFKPGDPIPLYLDKNSESLKVIQRLRDEAHRFGITHHRNKRSKAFIVSELHGIEGIGSKTADALLAYFKSIDAIKNATVDEMGRVIGKAKATIVMNYFGR